MKNTSSANISGSTAEHTSLSVGILTLGCKVNQYESEAIAEACKNAGLTVLSSDDPCDIYIINTCSVTAEADRKSCQMIRRLKKQAPDPVIIVTGCVAQRDPEKLKKIPGVGYVVGNGAKMQCAAICAGLQNKTITPPENATEYITDVEDSAFEKMKISAYPRTRQVIKIEDGCENRCAYCAIPDGRGKVRSKPSADVLEEVLDFCKSGSREIVLTGIETASYGKDTGETLKDLLELIDDKCSGYPVRFRLGSIWPGLFTGEFVSSISTLSTVAKHFHISMQSGSDNVLNGMGRPYTRKLADASLARLRSAMPGVMFTTDIIVGFPGETDEDFEETRCFILENKFLYVHIFPYSKRAGTPAAVMPEQVPDEIKKKRASVLAADAKLARKAAINEYVSKFESLDVLVETEKDGLLYGHSDNFIDCVFEGPATLKGEVVTVKPDIYRDGVLVCKPI